MLRDRPAQREVDRPLRLHRSRAPTASAGSTRGIEQPVGFFAAIFGSLSSIPREQPIRDNLEALAAQSRERARAARDRRRAAPRGRGRGREAVRLTLFLDRPTAQAPGRVARQGAAGRGRTSGLSPSTPMPRSRSRGSSRRWRGLILEAAPALASWPTPAPIAAAAAARARRSAGSHLADSLAAARAGRRSRSCARTTALPHPPPAPARAAAVARMGADPDAFPRTRSSRRAMRSIASWRSISRARRARRWATDFAPTGRTA